MGILGRGLPVLGHVFGPVVVVESAEEDAMMPVVARGEVKVRGTNAAAAGTDAK